MINIKVKVLIVLVGLSVLGVMGYIRNLKNQNKILGAEIEALKKDPQSVAKEEIKQLVDKLSKLVVLPEGEDPVVATVTDKEKLKEQPVFAKAENGDKILIFAKAQKAYIFSPAKNVLVDVIPVNIGDQQISITGVDAKNPLEVALVNGSKNAGVTSELEKRINDKNIVGLKVVSKATAKSDNYDKTLVFDVDGKHGKQAQEMATLVNGVVATQSAESFPKADLMIVIGSDFK